MCISGAIFEYQCEHIDERERELKGWEFDMRQLRESEGASFSSLDRRSPRAFSTNVSNDVPKNYCHYSGLVSTSAYME
tara:strand:- start:36 stop:269 length:234 start_codon:yes stop_codon:yes gene_type:complete